MTMIITPPAEGQSDALALPLVKANGFTIISDAGAVGPDGDLHLLSLLGRKAAVEAIGAACLSGKAVLVYPEPGRSGFEAQAPASWGWRTFCSARAGGEAHLVLLPRRADVTRLVEGAFTVAAPLAPAPLSPADGEGDAAGPTRSALAWLHYLFLSRAVATPLAEMWDGWLWRRALARDEALPLRCWGALPAAYSCHPCEEDLRADLRAALAGDTTHGPLPRPTARPAVQHARHPAGAALAAPHHPAPTRVAS